VVEVFAGVLGSGIVGLDDDFFDGGGDSLGVVRVLGDLEHTTGVRVPMAAFLGTPTPRAIAGLIERIQEGWGRDRGGDDSVGDRAALGDDLGGDGAPVFVVTPLGNAASPIMRCMDWSGRPLHNLDLPIIEASGEPVSYQTIGAAASRLVDELNEFQPGCSECSLLGFSFGGLVVCEMARQLEARGIVVNALVLIDPSYPRVEMRSFQTDPRVRAHAAGAFERQLPPPESLETLSGRIRHWISILRDRVAVRTRLTWMRLKLDRALGGRRWRRGLSADEELAWFLREVRLVEKRSPLQAFDLAAPVFVFLASDSYRDDLELRWRLLVGEDAELDLLEGDHLGILDEDRNHLGDRLRRVFDRLDGGRLRTRIRQSGP
jgi:thioesterase domain-containing protein/acyl carrier protein